MATDVGTLTAKLVADTRGFVRGMQVAERQMTASQKRMQNLGQSMSNVGRRATMFVSAPIVGAFALSAKAAIDFESSFAGVRKTVDASPAEFEQLEKGIRDMATEIPSSANELAGIGEIAGQLGVPLGEGTETMQTFIRTVADLGETTNIAGEEAATSFARIANIMEEPIENVDRMGSVVVDLGNNFATTEREIVNFANRMAGAGKIAGITTDEIFAIGTAFSSVGVRAERGGTAVQKVLLNMVSAVQNGGDQLVLFAETAGVTAEEFARTFEQDASAAFAQFVEGLGDQGKQASQTLDELGLADQRLMGAFLSLAQTGDLLTRTLETGSTAWEENTALAEEAEKRYQTTGAQLEVLRNRVTDAAIGFGEVLLPPLISVAEGVTAFAETLGKLPRPMQAAVAVTGGLAAAVGPLLVVGGSLLRNFAELERAAPRVAGGLRRVGSTAATAAPAVGLLAVALIEVLKKRKEIEDTGDTIAESFTEGGEGIAEAVGQLRELEDAADPSIGRQIRDAFLDPLGSSGQEAAEKLDAARESVFDFTDAVIRSGKSTNEQVNSAIALNAAVEEYGLTSDEAARAQIRLNNALEPAAAIEREAADAMVDLKNAVAEFGSDSTEAKNAAKALTDAQEEQTSINEGAAKAMAAVGGEVDQFGVGLEDLTDELEDSSDAAAVWSEDVQQAIAGALDPSNFSDKAQKSLGAFKAELQQNLADMREWRNVIIALSEAGFDRLAQQAGSMGPEFVTPFKQALDAGDAELRELEGLMVEVDRLTVEPDINVDAGSARREIGGVERSLLRFNGMSVSAAMGVDTRDAFLGINAIHRRLEDFRRNASRRIPIRVQTPGGRGFAHGGRDVAGGLALVGERGPELVNLPKGADVFSNPESRRMVSSVPDMSALTVGGGGGSMGGGTTRVELVIRGDGPIAQAVAEQLNLEAQRGTALLESRVVEN